MAVPLLPASFITVDCIGQCTNQINLQTSPNQAMTLERRSEPWMVPNPFSRGPDIGWGCDRSSDSAWFLLGSSEISCEEVGRQTVKKGKKRAEALLRIALLYLWFLSKSSAPRIISKMRLFILPPALGLCILLAFLIPQAVALPPSTREQSLVLGGAQSSQPWFIRRRFHLVPIQPSVKYPTPRSTHEIHILPEPSFKKRHPSLVRRSPFTGPQGMTIGVAIIVTISVLLGLGIGSIAIFGFEWKKFFGKSSAKSQKEALIEPSLRDESQQPTYPPIRIEEPGGRKNYR